MAIGESLAAKLHKKFERSSTIEMRYKGKDLVFKTDEEGNPVLLFIGARNSEGKINGERYVRTLKKNSSGAVIKDHWDLKGKATA